MKYTCCKCLSVSWCLTDSVTCTRGLLRNLMIIKLTGRSLAEASKAPCRRTDIYETQKGVLRLCFQATDVPRHLLPISRD